MRPHRRHSKLGFGVLLLGLAGLGLDSAAARGQVLAQRNWAGSGVTVEPWWRRAVFYRIDPERFQDSDGDGKGDLAGIVQRLDYLQSLGVDALILSPAPSSAATANQAPAANPAQAANPAVSDPPPATGFDDLTRAAVSHHIRVLVDLGAPASQAADAAYLAVARSWLNQGAAGLYMPTAAVQAVDGEGHVAQLLHQLRLLTNSFPGERVLLADVAAKPNPDLTKALEQETQLTASTPISTALPTAASLRMQLMVRLGSVQTTAESHPLMLAARVGDQDDPAARSGLERTLAVMLLASRTAVILEYGQELGLDTDGHGRVAMQWTPSNVTRKPAPPPEKVEAPAVPAADYSGFHPFVPPPQLRLPPLRMPVVIESDNPQPAVIEPDSMPGFTTGALDPARTAANGATANVAIEQADPGSLLNLYRQLIEMHRGNATVRNGQQQVLNPRPESAVVWVRRAPAGSKTSSNVIAACNLTGKAVALTLRDLQAAGPGIQGLRPVVGTATPEGGVLTLAAYGVLVGEAH